MIGPGDRIEFKAGSDPYEWGLRTATVIDLVTFRVALMRDAQRRGIPWPVQAEEHARTLVVLGEVPVPWVAVDPVPETGVGEDQIGALWDWFTILPAESPDYSYSS